LTAIKSPDIMRIKKVGSADKDRHFYYYGLADKRKVGEGWRVKQAVLLGELLSIPAAAVKPREKSRDCPI